MTVPGPRASWLFVPGDQAEKLDKALTRTSPDTVIIVDLEDAVAESAVDHAYGELDRVGRTYDRGFVCRVRGDDDVVLADIAQLPPSCWGVILPKAEDPDLVATVAAAVRRGAPERRLWLLVETPAGVEDLPLLLAGSYDVEGVMLGSGDLRALTGARATDDEIELLYPRSRVVFVARRHGLVDVIDGPDPDFRDLAAVERRARTARALGMTAKAAIHPAQLDAIAAAFVPTEQEIRRAREVLAAPDGASASHGTLIDAATKLQAQALLERAPRTVNQEER